MSNHLIFYFTLSTLCVTTATPALSWIQKLSTSPVVPEGCKMNCTVDANCTSGKLYTNPCALCDRSGICVPVCGSGCRTDADCRPAGGGNPCTTCDTESRICVNPKPLCGSFCAGVDAACKADGTGDCSDGCCECSQIDWTAGCSKSQNSTCGKICAGYKECAGSATCPECVGYYCSKPASCGQNCVSSGQCQKNPGECHSCVGTNCENGRACGAACGSAEWCGTSCPVCGNIATCISSEQHEKEIGQAKQENILDALLKQGIEMRRHVREQYVNKKLSETQDSEEREKRKQSYASYLAGSEER